MLSLMLVESAEPKEIETTIQADGQEFVETCPERGLIQALVNLTVYSDNPVQGSLRVKKDGQGFYNEVAWNASFDGTWQPVQGRTSELVWVGRGSKMGVQFYENNSQAVTVYVRVRHFYLVDGQL